MAAKTKPIRPNMLTPRNWAPAFEEDAEHRGTQDEGGDEEGEDQAVGEDVDLGDQLVEPGVPEADLDLAVLEFVEERVDLARVIREGVGLGDRARQAAGDVGRVPVTGDEGLGRPPPPLLSAFPPRALSASTRKSCHLGDLDVQPRSTPADRFQARVPDLLEGVFAPQGSAQRRPASRAVRA